MTVRYEVAGESPTYRGCKHAVAMSRIVEQDPSKQISPGRQPPYDTCHQLAVANYPDRLPRRNAIKIARGMPAQLSQPDPWVGNPDHLASFRLVTEGRHARVAGAVNRTLRRARVATEGQLPIM